MEISGGLDIIAYASTQAINDVQSQVSVAMLDKTLEMQQVMGDNMAKLMEMSVNPSLGGNIDIRI